MTASIKFRFAIFTLCLMAAFVSASQIILSPAEQTRFSERWKWAHNQIKKSRSGGWIGYTINNRDSIHVCSHVHHSKDYATLEELMKAQNLSPDRLGLSRKKTGLLLYFNNKQICDFKVSDLDSPVKLNRKSVYWIGNLSHEESCKQLKSLYHKTNDQEMREDLIFAIAMHTQSDQSLPFLKQIIQSDAQDALRKTAVFWTGNYHESELDFLIDLSRNDRSKAVRKSAVFAVSRSETDKAFEALIQIAKSNPDIEMRKEAIFWMAQQHNEQAGNTLRKMVFDDNLMEIQKHAIFALSQWGDDSAADDLLNIIDHHPNPKIRKQAIFWLSQTDNTKALDALVGIIEKRRN